MRYAAATLILMLTACAQGGSAANASLPLPQNAAPQGRATGPVVDPLAGVSANYIVETGKNADGQFQVDVRQVQEPSIFASPEPFTLAIVQYPDTSLQHVDANGRFDAAESTYAAKHGQSIFAPNVTVHIVSTTGLAFEPSTFQIYVPNKREERSESTVADTIAFRRLGNVAPVACAAHHTQTDLAPNDVAGFTFVSRNFLGIAFPVDVGRCSGKPALGRVVDYLWVSGSSRYRYTLRYQAPSRAQLAADGASPVGEYVDLPSTDATATRLSPRYVVACPSTGC
jgi:hypothetical protein